MGLWIAVSCILFFLCVLEAIILLKDKGTVAHYIKQFKTMATNRGLIHTVKYTVSFLLEKFHESFSWESSKNKADKNTVRIAILIGGGIGDFLIIANWFEYFRKKYLTENDYVDIVYKSKSALAIFKQDKKIRLIKKNEYHSASYSVVIFISLYPIIKSVNKQMLKNVSQDLQDYLSKAYEFYNENKFECDNHPRADALVSIRTIISGKNRLQEPDIYGLLNISQEYKYDLPINEDEEGYLKKIVLEKNNYILVHRGWDAFNGDKFHVKAWSLNSCGDMIPRLKEEFPEYKIVLFGASAKQAPPTNGCDLNLIGKTSLEQVKVLLKHAKCLIDNEGGMVHMRYAVHGGPSVVLFGATSPTFFGYPDNINITSSVCSHWCEWIVNHWEQKCIKTGKATAACMEAITTDDVIAGVKRALG